MKKTLTAFMTTLMIFTAVLPAYGQQTDVAPAQQTTETTPERTVRATYYSLSVNGYGSALSKNFGVASGNWFGATFKVNSGNTIEVTIVDPNGRAVQSRTMVGPIELGDSRGYIETYTTTSGNYSFLVQNQNSTKANIRYSPYVE